MSDCFDHECDAWDQRIIMEFDGNEDSTTGYNPDYYHAWINIQKIIKETEKAYLILFSGAEIWVAKSLIRDKKDDSIFVHLNSFKNILINIQNKNKAENN